MKNILNKIKDGVFIGVGIILVLGIANSWEDLGTVTNGDSLTDTVWNNLVTKVNETGNRVSGIFTDESGKVGIGTETPNYKLTVNSDGNGGIWNDATLGSRIVANTKSETNGGTSFVLKTPSKQWNLSSSTIDGSTYEDDFYVSNITDGRLGLLIENDTGNVGIGNSVPSTKLDVAGGIKGNELVGPWDNSDNGYIRLGDVQIARGKQTTSTWPAIITYPIAFSEPPTVTATNPRSGYFTTIGTGNVGPTATGFNCYVISSGGATATVTTDCNWIAVGKWR